MVDGMQSKANHLLSSGGNTELLSYHTKYDFCGKIDFTLNWLLQKQLTAAFVPAKQSFLTTKAILFEKCVRVTSYVGLYNSTL